MNPRKPNEEEKEALFEYLISQGWGMGTVSEEVVDKNLNDQINISAVAVFDQYTIVSPEYRGKVMVVVWVHSLGIETETFIWRGGKMERLPNFT